MTADRSNLPLSGEELHTLGDVRAAIDRLDDELVPLLCARLVAIRRAAELKNEPADALVEWRVEEVADRVRRRALGTGGDADLAERIWRGMMDECIAYERAAIAARG